jgi:hypothetical protein
MPSNDHESAAPFFGVGWIRLFGLSFRRHALTPSGRLFLPRTRCYRERPVPDLGPALQDLQHVGACDARAKKTVAINLADVRYLVADRRDPADGRLQPLL